MPVSFPTYRLHRPSGKVVVTLNGRDFYLGDWNSPASRQEYDRLIAEWAGNGRQLPVAVPMGELTVVELIAAYLQFAKVDYVQHGQVTSEYIAVRHVLKLVNELYGRTLTKYNHRRPHSGLNWQTPAAYAARLDDRAAGVFPSASRVASPVGATPLPPTPHAV